ncbi:LPS-assembly protein LptD [Rubellimicrobium aerolatum]|uniref:LPS-assembly protein LptD n=1 Tax=Rubellimicrobium aerolatum TaxID=490979 RepID=A0ABW0SB59_9RHOB|nr:LPS assembly protein LptD [Rubellimicrobium aerolatum]MBP1805470.1 LPS-assembly protein [Rubellimicrobium aerolatum]
MRRLLLALLLLLALPVRAQEAAVLVADSLVVTEGGRLVASGNVQAYHEGIVLSAAEVAYDPATERLLIAGPILIRDPQGTVVTAERAELDPRLEDGLLRGARLVLDRQLQLAANRLDRVGGLTALTGTAVTSCRVCAGRAPLWEIRAEQVIHDEAAEQLYFENARVLVRGVPILWVPRMRLPDPGNARATGLLIPRIRTTDRLGFGVKLPVFVELGPSRDVTLTPYVSSRTMTLETRYRQAFLSGELEMDGAASRDDLEDEARGYLAAEGRFRLTDRVDLTFEGTAVSDEAYLLDYGQSDADRLESSLRLSRVTAGSLLEAEVTHIRSLRDEEDEESLPPVLGRLSWERRRDAGGGTLTWGAAADGFLRTGDGSGDAARDVTRAGAMAEWRGDRVLGPGLLLEGEVRGALDAWRVTDDDSYPDPLFRAAPGAAATLRWPLVRRSGTAADLLEPVASLGWQAAWGDEPPDEDSRLPELDEANLFALSRLPGEDEVEAGGRLSLGLAWTRTGQGYASTLALGRVLRTEPLDASGASGLGGTASDWLLSGQLDLAGGFALDARTLLEAGEIGKSEARVGWANRAVSLSAAYLFLPADAAEDRADLAAEWTVDAEWRPSARWTLGIGTRYDVASGTPARAGLDLGWRSECVEVDVSVSRRYTSSDDTEPSTDFGLSVNLNGFSAGRQARVTPGRCRG